MKEILINHHGDGEWIMEQCEGVFRPGLSHSIANHRDGKLVGGFVLDLFLGRSMAVHMAGSDPRWCSRDLLWMLGHYAFVQVGVSKLLATVASDNYKALELDIRSGYEVEATIRDAFDVGRHLIVLTLSKENCKWLAFRPQNYQPGGVLAHG